MQKLVSTSVILLALAGASVPALAAPLGDPGNYGPYAGHVDRHTGGPANIYYGARGETPPYDVHAQKWAICEELYPTFQPSTGTFVGNDGLTYACQ